MPLKAYSANHEEKLAFDLTLDDRSKSYYCPICADIFRLVMPVKTLRIKHFRHTNGHNHGEPETPEHLSMKLACIESAKALGFDAEPEFIVNKERDYIADVLVKTPKFTYAIECQCANKSTEELIEKTNYYISQGYVPVWIFGGKWFDNVNNFKQHKRQGRRAYKIQRISLLETLISRNKRSLWFQEVSITNNICSFFTVDFKHRAYSKYFGWYSKQKVSFETILNESLNQLMNNQNLSTYLSSVVLHGKCRCGGYGFLKLNIRYPNRCCVWCLKSLGDFINNDDIPTAKMIYSEYFGDWRSFEDKTVIAKTAVRISKEATESRLAFLTASDKLASFHAQKSSLEATQV